MAIPENETESLALTKFEKVVEDLGFERGVLMRFLRARELDLTQAEETIRKFVLWKETFEGNKFEGVAQPKILDVFDYYFTGFDGQGRPVIFVPAFGTWPAFRDVLDEIDEMDMFRFSAQTFDPFYRLLLKTKHQQCIIIYDVRGLTFSKCFYESRNFKGVNWLIKLLKIFEAYYPEILFKGMCINASLALQWLWKIVEVLVSDHTLAKVSFYGSSPSEVERMRGELFSILPENVILEKYGGSAKGVVLYDEEMKKIVNSYINNE